MSFYGPRDLVEQSERLLEVRCRKYGCVVLVVTREAPQIAVTGYSIWVAEQGATAAQDVHDRRDVEHDTIEPIAVRCAHGPTMITRPADLRARVWDCDPNGRAPVVVELWQIADVDSRDSLAERVKGHLERDAWRRERQRADNVPLSRLVPRHRRMLEVRCEPAGCLVAVVERTDPPTVIYRRGLRAGLEVVAEIGCAHDTTHRITVPEALRAKVDLFDPSSRKPRTVGTKEVARVEPFEERVAAESAEFDRIRQQDC